jgi:hypothetical protein
MKHFLLIGITLLAWLSSINAQVNCSEQLIQAQRRFDEGLLDDIPQLLESCLISGFTKEERLNAQKLLVLTYLFRDDAQNADDEMLRFLRGFPEYSITSSDPKEFVNLYNTYRTDPILRIEPFMGLNYSMPFVFEHFGVGDLNQNVPEYSSGFGLSAGANYTDRLNEKLDWSFGLAVHYSGVDYFYQVFDYTFINGRYTEIYAGLPASVRYYFSKRNTFIKAGIETSFLLSSKNNLSRGFNTGDDDIVGTLNLTGYHRKVDIRPVLGIGFSPKFGNVKLLVDAGFRMATIAPVKKDLRYSNEEAFEKFFFIEDKWVFNHFYLNVSYVFSVYKPVKLR